MYDDVENFSSYLAEQIQNATPIVILGLMTFVYGSLIDVLRNYILNDTDTKKLVLFDRNTRVSESNVSRTVNWKTMIEEDTRTPIDGLVRRLHCL